MKFSCSVCSYTSFRKNDVEKHFNKKNKCGNGIPEIIEIPVDIKCEFCNKLFTTNSSMKRHIKTCKINDKIKELEDKLAQKSNIITIIDNSTNTNIKQNFITIQLRPHDDPKLPDNISELNDIYEEAWDKKKSVQTFIERIHFNPDIPENHNMCITNLRTNLAKVFTGHGWDTRDQNKFLDEVITNSNKLLYKWVKSNKKRREKYENDFIEYIEQEGKKKFDNETKTEVKLLLYDAYKKGIVDIKTSSKQYQPFEED
jgi:hypothetical protein